MKSSPPGGLRGPGGPHRGVHDGAETFSGPTLVDELQDLLRDGQRGRRAEGGQLLLILVLLRSKTWRHTSVSSRPLRVKVPPPGGAAPPPPPR